MKKIFLLAGVLAFALACSNAPENGNKADDSAKVEKPVDEGLGIGEFKNVVLTNPLDPEKITRGKAIYELKCAACHRLSDMRVVGPGFKDVTKRRKPAWILNMITNVEVMLDQDPEAQKLLEQCLTRMPNQNVSAQDAYDVLELFRQNDGEE